MCLFSKDFFVKIACNCWGCCVVCRRKCLKVLSRVLLCDIASNQISPGSSSPMIVDANYQIPPSPASGGESGTSLFLYVALVTTQVTDVPSNSQRQECISLLFSGITVTGRTKASHFFLDYY